MAEVKWIKITTDIFDDEKILLIESLPDSYAIITVWFKLLCLAGKQNNSGVFMMGRVAYTDKMLATIFRMKEATVTMALRIFEEFGMVEIIDGVITIPNWGKHQNLEGIELAREKTRQRVAAYRSRQKELAQCNVTDCYSNVTVTHTDKERDKEGEKDIISEPKRFTPPTVEQVAEYCKERNNAVVSEKFVTYYSSIGWKVGKNKMKDWKAAVRTWERSEFNKKGQTRFEERSYTREELDAHIRDPLAEMMEEL